MSTYDDASLVLIPSGYKNGVVFSQKPMDANGQLTFTRASDATRVGPNGYIEKVRTNVFKYSEQFNQVSAWSLQAGATISANAGTAPDGTTTADLLYPSVSAAVVAVIQTLTTTNGVEYGQSVYVKAAGKNYAALYTLNGSTGTAMWVNLTTGAITNGSGPNVTGRFATDAGNGWWRIGLTDLGNGSIGYMHLYPTDSDSVITITPNGTDGILVWGAQMETSVPTEYIKTEAAAVSVGPVSGTPRLDYLGSDCPRLLLEPQRTNIQTSSEDFNTGPYTKIDIGVISNATTAPDGYNGADKIFATGGNTRHLLYGAPAVNGTYTFSVFAKAGEKNWLILRLDDDTPEVNTWFNLSTGTIGTSQGGNPTITPYGNGWYRCSVTYTTSGTETIYNVMYVANADNVQAWTPSGTDGLYIWGAQVEAGAYATSYIPTLGTSVTRVADLAQKTSAAALIGQTEGTIYWEIQLETPVATAHEDILNIDNGGFGNTIYLVKTTSGAVGAEIYNAGGLQASFFLAGLPAGTYKCALGYANNNTAFFLNGTQVSTTDTSCTIPATSRIQLGNGGLGPSTGLTKQLLLFPTRLTNAQLAELTSL
jgi:hypothetical protein